MTHPTGLGEYKDYELIAEMVSRGYVVNADVQIEPTLDDDDSDLDKIITSTMQDAMKGQRIVDFGGKCLPYLEPIKIRVKAKQAILTLMEKEKKEMLDRLNKQNTFEVRGIENVCVIPFFVVQAEYAALTPQSPTKKEGMSDEER